MERNNSQTRLLPTIPTIELISSSSPDLEEILSHYVGKRAGVTKHYENRPVYHEGVLHVEAVRDVSGFAQRYYFIKQDEGLVPIFPEDTIHVGIQTKK